METGRLYCRERALWKLNWFLRDVTPGLFSCFGTALLTVQKLGSLCVDAPQCLVVHRLQTYRGRDDLATGLEACTMPHARGASS
jgi:hypothetical protein